MTTPFIDKIAFIDIKNKKILVTLSKGKDVWYLPGGKRENGETDHETLIREVKEEITVDIVPSSIQFYGIFKAQAHGQALGVMVKMSCYTGSYTGIIVASNEIAQIDYFDYSQKQLTSLVDHLIFDDLKSKEFIK